MSKPSRNVKLPARRVQADRPRSANSLSAVFNPLAGRPSLPFSNLVPEIHVVLTGNVPITFTSSTTVPVYGNALFSLGTFAGSSEYTSLFDQYRIDMLEVWIVPLNAQGTTVFGEFDSAVDLDDSNTPATADTVRSKQGAIQTYSGNGHYHRWRPHVAIAGYTGSFSGFTNVSSRWIDSASTAVQHYGLKIALGATPVAVSYQMHYRAHASFRAPGL
jgi:hypothetical protein